MPDAVVQPMIEPDAEQMLRHVEHLFGGYLDGTVNLMVVDERKSRRGGSGGQAAAPAPVTAAQTSKALARAARYWSAVT